MALIDLLEKLQKKPRYIKIQIMWVGVIIFMVLIFSFWVWSLGNLVAQSKKTSADNNQIAQSLEQAKKDIPTLWQSLGAGIGNIFNSAKEDLETEEMPYTTSEYQTIEGRLPLE